MSADILPLSWPGAPDDANVQWDRLRRLMRLYVHEGEAVRPALEAAFTEFLRSGGPLRIGEIRQWIG